MRYQIAFVSALLLMCAGPAAADTQKKEEMMKQVDQDKDNMVSQQEFLEHKEQKFKDADTNSDGKLSSNEWTSMMQKERQSARGSMGDTSGTSASDRMGATGSTGSTGSVGSTGSPSRQ